jgi:hypothetical protein
MGEIKNPHRILILKIAASTRRKENHRNSRN